ncbi:MAG: hypothetical protein JF606_28835 [Burkholderiales bacterium]|nr:hypothetical protein [Burkholderiales bacterium]
MKHHRESGIASHTWLERLGWQARRDLEQTSTDMWRWRRMNPQGHGVATRSGAGRSCMTIPT